jgi:AcrR family transcriptional regulator
MEDSMDPAPRRRPGRQPRVSREQVLDAALAIADEEGLAAVTMANVGSRLEVQAMSLYRHIGNKEEMLDGLVDRVFAEIEVPRDVDDWRAALRRRAVSAREALGRHPWAIGLLESRAQPGPTTLAHHDAMLAILFGAGFTGHEATRAYNLLDSYIYGFALQEASLPFSTPEEMAEMSERMLAAMTDTYPHLARVQRELVGTGFAYADEFEAGLDIILGALPEPRAGRSPDRQDR